MSCEGGAETSGHGDEHAGHADRRLLQSGAAGGAQDTHASEPASGAQQEAGSDHAELPNTGTVGATTLDHPHDESEEAVKTVLTGDSLEAPTAGTTGAALANCDGVCLCHCFASQREKYWPQQYHTPQPPAFAQRNRTGTYGTRQPPERCVVQCAKT